MKNIDYLIEVLIKEDEKLSNVNIPDSIDEKKELYRALRNIRKPKPISDDYLKMQDEYLQEEIRTRGIVDHKDIPSNNKISIWVGDITTLKCDAIVSASNKYLLGCFNPNHMCIDNAIHSFAGMELRWECNKIMQGSTLPNGEAILTRAYNLPSDYIIHTVGPNSGRKPTKRAREELRKCYFNTLEIAKEKGFKSIAFPSISTGIYGFPKVEACKIAIKTVLDYISENDVFEHIIFNVFSEEDYKIYYDCYEKLRDIAMTSHLHGYVYDIIKSGQKDIEVRVYDEKRRKLKVKDKILFLNRDDINEYIVVSVKSLTVYKKFAELIDSYDMSRLYLKDYTKEKFNSELEKFYSVEEQEKYGVVAIEFERLL